MASTDSASASAATSRDALEALALAIRPTVHAGSQSEGGVRVENNSLFDAADIEVVAERRDGQTVRTERALLRGRDESEPSSKGESFDASVGDLRDDLGIQSHAALPATVKTLWVRYSDSRRIARYERRVDYHFDIEGGRGTAGVDPRSVRRIR